MKCWIDDEGIYRVHAKAIDRPACIAGQWERDKFGNIQAWYTQEQIAFCLEITRPQTIREYMAGKQNE